ncbi:MAG TPA: PilZ domain-containing protein [Solirubrobacteraceae bacterium]|nr:PilZ domain-containing protein [Solirubrobacteraceae bacterium]
MSENRRDAWRLPHAGIGWLAAEGFRAICIVEDISVTGARVRLTRARPGSGDLPAELTLTVVVGGEQVTLHGTVRRLESETEVLSFAMRFSDGETVGLGWLINQAQRANMRRRSDGGSEERRGA